jgi:hypothetical protein
MFSIESRISFYQSEIETLNNKLSKIQRGISWKMRKTAIDIIFKIFHLESLIEKMKESIKTCEVVELRIKAIRSGCAWLAELDSKKDKKHGGFSKTFIEPVSREFGKKGEIAATFEVPVNLYAVYQDSEGDFWVFKDSEGDTQVISYQEAKFRLEGGKIG